MRRFSTVAAVAAGALLAGTVSASAAITYSATQGLQSDGNAVAANRSNPDNAHDGNSGTFFSLGVGGSLVASSSLGALGGSVIEVTFGSPSTTFPESAQVFLDFGLGSQTLFGELFNNAAPTFNGALGSITLDSQGGTTSTWTLTLNSPPAPVFNIALQDTTLINFSGSYGGNGQPSFTDGFDVAEFSVSEVPLPASVLMLLAALGGLGFFGPGRKVA